MILIRSAIYNVYVFILTWACVAAGTVLRFTAPHRVIDVVRFWGRMAVGGARTICGISFVVTGQQYLPRTGPALIASSHQSAFDTVVWLTLLPGCCYVLKQELVDIPLFGGLAAPSGMIAVDRDGGAAAIRGLIRDGERALAAGRQIVIFPEGTRAEPGAQLPLQPGIAALARRTGLPVIPVATDSGLYWGRRAFRKVPGVIRIVIKPPIPAGVSRQELMQRLMKAFNEDGMNDQPIVDKSVG
jgi:1-acyl-sn-glycerol-3-phosphate acyltransferase